jgi:molecular chaperone Hsp33
MKVQQNLGILETMILGQAALCGALMIPMMKGKEHSVWKYNVDGPAAGFSIEADSSGYVRGFLLNNNIPIEKPLENWDLRSFLGTGTMTISRVHDNDKIPQASTVEVNSKNIAEDLAWYYRQSEQLQTAFNTSIQLDKQGRVIGAGAMFLQVIPKTGGTEKLGSQVDSASDVDENEELLRSVENAFSAAPSLGQWFSEDGKIDDIVYGLFREFNPSIVLHRDIVFDCPCSQEYFTKYLQSLPKEQLEEIKKDSKPIEISCRNCGSIYTIPLENI